MRPEFTIIVNSRDDRRFRFFQDCFVQRLAEASPEILRIADAQSMAEGYNRGAAAAHADWLVFCHDDIAILSNEPLAALREAMAGTDVFGVCGTCRLISGNWYDAGAPHLFGAVVAPLGGRPWQRELQIFGLGKRPLVNGAQALDGILIACHRSVFETLGGFDSENFPRFVGYDVDFTYRAFLGGWRVGIQTDLLLLHQSIVTEFSSRKYRDWEEAMATLVNMYGTKFERTGGVRGHLSLPVPGYDPTSALKVLQGIRRPAPG